MKPMSCKHKFQQQLLLEMLDFKPRRLVIGTFNPAWPDSNEAQWFYGRTTNNYFWEILPRLHNQKSLINSKVAGWKLFCKENSIAITDLISCISDANEENQEHQHWLSNYSDKNIAERFHKHEIVNIIELLESNRLIEKVYFTRSANASFWKKLWQPIEAYCRAKGIYCTTLLTPSGYAFYQHGRYKKLNPESSLSLADYILMKWQQVW